MSGFDSLIVMLNCVINYFPKEEWTLTVRRNLNNWVLTALTDLLCPCRVIEVTQMKEIEYGGFLAVKVNYL